MELRDPAQVQPAVGDRRGALGRLVLVAACSISSGALVIEALGFLLSTDLRDLGLGASFVLMWVVWNGGWGLIAGLAAAVLGVQWLLRKASPAFTPANRATFAIAILAFTLGDLLVFSRIDGVVGGAWHTAQTAALVILGIALASSLVIRWRLGSA